jgi:hypothetical protein
MMTTQDTTHECPAPVCKERVPEHQLACRRHWRLIPRPMQRAVWAAWDGGRGRSTHAHRAAMLAVTRHLERQGE